MNGIALLALAQMLSASGLTVLVLLGGIVAADIAPRESWATVPVSLAVVVLALATVPAAVLMRRAGRRFGFVFGALIGAAGGAFCTLGIVRGSFAVFCLGACLLGASVAFAQQYRFAAAESVPPELMSRAVSYVLIGSLGAAVIGPQLALASRHWLFEAEYAGSFVTVALLYLGAVLVLARLNLPAPAAEQRGAPLAVRDILVNTRFRVAVFAGVVAFAVMSFVMTAAPISMHVMDHHSVEATTWVIQSHVLAMYLPALVSGRVIARFGERAVMMWGGALLAGCAAASLSGQHVVHYWLGLVLLGVGWNLLFVAGTTMLAREFRGGDRHRAQAVNEFTVFGAQACASLLAGAAVHTFGWQMLNLVTLPLLALMIFAASRLQPAPLRADAAAAE